MVNQEYICELYKTGFYVNERPQFCEDYQKSNEIKNSENLLFIDDLRLAEGIVFGIIISILIWILIISFINWVIP